MVHSHEVNLAESLKLLQRTGTLLLTLLLRHEKIFAMQLLQPALLNQVGLKLQRITVDRFFTESLKCSKEDRINSFLRSH